MDTIDMQREIRALQTKLCVFHEEMSGTSFSNESIMGRLEHFHFIDYTGAALDALGDLSGVITKYGEE